MRMARVAVTLALALALAVVLGGCAPGFVSASRRPDTQAAHAADRFKLGSVREATIAVLPATDAAIDPSILGVVENTYGTPARFLQVLSAKVSAAALRVCRRQSVDVTSMRAILASAPITATVLEPGGALEDASAPGGPPLSRPGLIVAAHDPRLEKIRYALVLRGIRLAKKNALIPIGYTTATGQAGTTTQIVEVAAGELDWAVVELPAARTVWSGTTVHHAFEPGGLAASLRGLEDELAQAVASELSPPAPRQPRGSP